MREFDPASRRGLKHPGNQKTRGLKPAIRLNFVSDVRFSGRGVVCRWALATGLALILFLSPVLAQEDDVTNSVIGYGEVVEDTITNESIYDLWAFYGVTGDHVHIEMQAADGLAPLVGVLDATRSLMLRSDELEDGTMINAEVNGMAVLDFTIPEEGEYVISATRAGNADGTTTGSYSLSLSLVEAPVNPYQDVTFLCGRNEITTVGTFEFHAEEEYRVTVLGLDGFEPVLRYEQAENPMVCTDQSESSAAVEARYTVPDEDAVTLSGTQLLLPKSQEPIELTLGSRNGQAGRYVMLVEGFAIEAGGDQDTISARLGPFAKDSEMNVYMVRAENTRIDPTVWLTINETNTLCDDAGRRGCEDIDSTIGLELQFEDGVVVSGERFDAGVKIATGNPDVVMVTFGSRTDSTTGEYYILIMGELPPRDG